LIDKDSIKVNGDLKFITPKGKVVYGGGGIIPDVFVAVDTTQYERWLYEAIRYSNLSDFFLKYVDAHRLEIENMGYKNYRENFDKNGAIYNEFTQYLQKKGINTTHNTNVENLLKLRIKAYVARLVWNDEKMYPIWDEIDPMLIKIDSLEKGTR
jgi:carboxyl-terminal processing protease